MKRFALLIAVVLAAMTSPASAAPGDAEMAAWRARWMDADFNIVIRYNPNKFHSDLAEDYQCRHELWVIAQAFPGTTAGRDALVIREYWWLMPKVGIRDTAYVP